MLRFYTCRAIRSGLEMRHVFPMPTRCFMTGAPDAGRRHYTSIFSADACQAMLSCSITIVAARKWPFPLYQYGSNAAVIGDSDVVVVIPR